MRKALKRKQRACHVCKPHKAGQSNRWKPRELVRLREAERLIRWALER